MLALHDDSRPRERAKSTLSSSIQTSIELDSEGIDFKSTLTKLKFKELRSVPFDAGKRRERGSTRIPCIHTLLHGFFDGGEFNKSINPDEAVAYEVAIQAAILIKPEGLEDLV